MDPMECTKIHNVCISCSAQEVWLSSVAFSASASSKCTLYMSCSCFSLMDLHLVAWYNICHIYNYRQESVLLYYTLLHDKYADKWDSIII